MIIRKLSSSVLKQRPYEAWNAFVTLLAKESYDDLDEVQRIAHLCFWYDSEVQNGGHLQYFENRGMLLLSETKVALLRLGAACQSEVLVSAGRLFAGTSRGRITAVEDYVAAAHENEFGAFDSAFHACVPTIQKQLMDFLERNRSHFIEVID